MNIRVFAIAISLALLNACGHLGEKDSAPASIPVDFNSVPDPVPRFEPLSRYGNPSVYEVRGVKYYPTKSAVGYVKEGGASWYGTKFHGRRTSSGEPYDMYKMTAAHKTLPLPSYVEVENLDNGKTIVVKVNDRGPFHAGRIIDLSYVAALKLDIVKNGVGRVRVRAIDVSANESQNSVFVQVGSFADKENAESLQVRLAESSIESDIHPVLLSAQNKMYRLRVGPFSSRQKASELVDNLEKIGINNAKVFSDNGENF